MSAPLDLLPLAPIPNENLAFVEEQQVTLHSKGGSISGRGTALIKWFPRPRVEINVSFDDKAPKADEFIVEFHGRTDHIPLVCTNRTDSGHGTEMTLRARREPFFVCSGDPLSSVFFCVLNFPELSASARSALVLEANGWRISLQQVPGSKEVYQKLEEEGGYAFTHVGEISRVDGGLFSNEKVCSLLEALHFFLSFAAGAWAPPAFPVGLAASGEKVWEEWGIGKSHMYGSARPSWMDKFSGESLTDIFPGFHKKWGSPIWRKTLNDVIYWYLNANNQSIGTDTGIILGQAALELFAWTDLTQDSQIVSENSFESPSMTENLRTVLHRSGIPLRIPSHLKDLRQLTQTLRRQYGDQDVDGPKIFTELRNNLVHPKDKRVEKHKKGLVTYECSVLGRWYIDLLLLHLFGYEGKYANRCKRSRYAGETEPVPWK